MVCWFNNFKGSSTAASKLVKSFSCSNDTTRFFHWRKSTYFWFAELKTICWKWGFSLAIHCGLVIFPRKPARISYTVSCDGLLMFSNMCYASPLMREWKNIFLQNESAVCLSWDLVGKILKHIHNLRFVVQDAQFCCGRLWQHGKFVNVIFENSIVVVAR